MEEIKILFFVIGTFFGIHQSNIIAEKATITINPEAKTITVLQENLISIIQNESDSLKVKSELENIIQPNYPWSSEFANYSKKEKYFFISEDTQTLNLKLTLTYKTTNDLKAFGINKNNVGKLSMTNFPKAHTKSTDGILGERYWNFNADAPFTFTEEPLTDIPTEYEIHKKSVLPFWKTIKR
ncbi:hypothetical protein KO504_00135 [Winogradskyella psychrotolerans]|uniref:hypothetical protein n=1 Tax=Winogradskyella psychrotolerans TaxID=1344585 RepID=UPI001C066BC0|nr:hypothetical protein [Winogradskyella psychrotolerans]MBU2919733.1 hypothetical protein [Winogradskyella psychrotolerans]